MKSVELHLFYRDSSNYKMSGTVTLAGPLDPLNVLRFQKAIDPEFGFVPSAVGLPHLTFDGAGLRSEEDTAWHTITSIRTSDAQPMDKRNFGEFVAECERIDWEIAALHWEANTDLKPCTSDNNELGQAA